MPPIEVTLNDAEAKRSTTQRGHNAFIGRLQGYLTTCHEDIELSFLKNMKDLYSVSSKKPINRE